MTLRDLLDGLGARVIGDAGVAVRAVRSDSREVGAGDVFVAVRGLRSDGHAFVPTAIERGAVAIVVERQVEGVTVPQAIVPNGAQALGVMVGHALGDPAKSMTLIGVTGTNGKTTTTYVVESILGAAGHKPGVIGTVELRWAGKRVPASYTTPTPQLLHDALAKMRDAGCTHVVMEVTSIALAAHRAAGMQFAVAAFSNLTQDHLDFHGAMADYFEAKRRLFAQAAIAVVNVGDEYGAQLAAELPGVVPFRREDDLAGIDLKLRGAFNRENALAAASAARAFGVEEDAIKRGIEAVERVPGRFEVVDEGQPFTVLVDYAHTPGALEATLEASRELTRGRVVCVFGAGGDRDRDKRPQMGRIVAELADIGIVTSDNPRGEDPAEIAADVADGLDLSIELDRRRAIERALELAREGDLVLVAGKGHEQGQEIAGRKLPFDDREVVRDTLRRLRAPA